MRAVAFLIVLLAVTITWIGPASANPLCDGRPATIVGSDRGEDLVGTHGVDDVIVALGGNDRVSVRAGSDDNDTVCLGGGDDTVFLTAGNRSTVTVFGGPGDDRFDIKGFGGEADLFGEGGADRFEVTALTYIWAGRGHLDGGPGRDWVELLALPVGAVIDFDRGEIRSSYENIVDIDFTVEAVENAIGGQGNDRMIGDDGINEFFGRGGDDTVSGNGGADFIFGEQGNDSLGGGDGDDHLQGDEGDDALAGGNGSDTTSYQFSPGSVTVLLWTGRASGASGNDRLFDIENVTGSNHDDFIIGNAAANRLRGLQGADHILGFPGDDQIRGDEGDDRLDGGFGSDWMDGGRNDDVCLTGPDQVEDVAINCERIE